MGSIKSKPFLKSCPVKWYLKKNTMVESKGKPRCSSVSFSCSKFGVGVSKRDQAGE